MSVADNAFGAGSDSEARRLHQLERAVSIALSPLPPDFADATHWGDALTAALCQLAGAAAGTILLPNSTNRWRAVSCAPDSEQHEAAWDIHEESTERLCDRTEGDLVFWVRDDLAADARQLPPTSSGTVGLRIRTPRGDVAAVCLYRDRALGPAPLQLIAALRAVAPAFRAGVAAWEASNTNRSSVIRMLDSLADPALLFDLAGQLVHANPPVDRLTTSVDLAKLRSEAQCMAWTLGATARRRSRQPASTATEPNDASRTRVVRFGTTVYRLRGSIVGEQLLGAEPGVLITLTVGAAEPLSDDVLRAEYGLTAREIQVARLIAEGLSNTEIGDRLGIRFFTARNHVERALAKLGVATRQRVGPLLRNETTEQTESGRAA